MAILTWRRMCLVLLALLCSMPALALRCGSDLVHEGDTKFEVLDKCGEPAAVEFVGYKLDGFGERDLVIEHLYYGPWNGWYYLIEIVGGRISKIESFKDN